MKKWLPALMIFALVLSSCGKDGPDVPESGSSSARVLPSVQFSTDNKPGLNYTASGTGARTKWPTCKKSEY